MNEERKIEVEEVDAVPAPPRARVTESFEVTRDVAATSGLPGGPVRLLERRADGSLAVLGEARLFDAATRVSTVDTIAVGTAHDVTATRERRELTVRDDVAPPDRPRSREQAALEVGQARLVHRDVVVGDCAAGEVGREPPAQIRHEPVTPV